MPTPSSAPDDDEDDHQKSTALLDTISLLRGKIVNAWAALDGEVIMLTSDIAKCPSYNMGVIYYALNNFSPRLSITKGLISHCLEDEEKKKFGIKLMTRLRDLAKRRNDFIHAEYVVARKPDERRFKVHKMIVRSERKEFIARSGGQTGELEDHLLQVENISTEINLYRLSLKG